MPTAATKWLPICRQPQAGAIWTSPTCIVRAADARCTPQSSVADTAVARRSPTAPLLVGLIVTLATVLAYSWYISRQITGLRQLQTDLTDRNRRDSLQLLRIQ